MFGGDFICFRNSAEYLWSCGRFRSGMGTETTSGLRSASVVAEQKSTGLLATHTDVLKTHESQSFSFVLLEFQIDWQQIFGIIGAT